MSKWFGSVRALDDVSFHVERGEVLGLLGPNGAGKTTSIRVLTGYLPPSQGIAKVCGHDVIEESAQARRALGYLPEAAPLYPEMSVEGYLAYRAGVYSLARGTRKSARDRVMQICELNSVRKRRIGALSKGFRQRVGLAAALLHDPQVLILDEPASGLDPAQILGVRALIRSLRERHAVLVSSHILPEVELTCDRVVIIAGGRVRADGAPAELVRSLRNEAPYFVEVVTPPGGVDVGATLRSIPGLREATPEQASEGWQGWKITGAAGAGDLRAAIGAACAAKGLAIRELTRRAPSLESLFLSVVGESGERGRGA